MPRTGFPSPAEERGQASISLLATIPVLLLTALLLLQLGLVGYAAWTAADAARAAARAAYTGADPKRAADNAIPFSGLVGDLDLHLEDGVASVAVEPLRLAPFEGLIPDLRLRAGSALVVAGRPPAGSGGSGHG